MNIPSSDIRRDARCEKGDFSLWFVARVLVVSFRVQSASCTRHHYRVTTLDRRHRRPAPRSLLPALLACGRNCIRRSSFCSGELDTRRKKKRPGRHCHWAHGVLRHLPANSSWRRAAKSAGGCWRRVWQGCAAQLAKNGRRARPCPCRRWPLHRRHHAGLHQHIRPRGQLPARCVGVSTLGTDRVRDLPTPTRHPPTPTQHIHRTPTARARARPAHTAPTFGSALTNLRLASRLPAAC